MRDEGLTADEKAEVHAILDEAFGPSFAMAVQYAMAKGLDAMNESAREQGEPALALAVGGVASAAAAAVRASRALDALKGDSADTPSAADVTRVTKETVRAERKGFADRLDQASPLNRAKTFAALSLIGTLIDSAKGVVQAKLVAKGEITPLIALAFIENKAEDSARGEMGLGPDVPVDLTRVLEDTMRARVRDMGKRKQEAAEAEDDDDAQASDVTDEHTFGAAFLDSFGTVKQ